KSEYNRKAQKGRNVNPLFQKIHRYLSCFARLTGGHFVRALLAEHFALAARSKLVARSRRRIALLAGYTRLGIPCAALAKHLAGAAFGEEPRLVTRTK